MITSFVRLEAAVESAGGEHEMPPTSETFTALERESSVSGSSTLAAPSTHGILFDTTEVESGRYRVRADESFGPAFLATTRRTYLLFCCVAWGFQRVVIEEGSIVEVLGIEHRSEHSEAAIAAAEAAAAAADAAADGSAAGRKSSRKANRKHRSIARNISGSGTAVSGAGGGAAAASVTVSAAKSGSVKRSKLPPDPDMFYRVRVLLCDSNRSLENEIGVIRSCFLDLSSPVSGGPTATSTAAGGSGQHRRRSSSGASDDGGVNDDSGSAAGAEADGGDGDWAPSYESGADAGDGGDAVAATKAAKAPKKSAVLDINALIEQLESGVDMRAVNAAAAAAATASGGAAVGLVDGLLDDDEFDLHSRIGGVLAGGGGGSGVGGGSGGAAGGDLDDDEFAQVHAGMRDDGLTTTTTGTNTNNIALTQPVGAVPASLPQPAEHRHAMEFHAAQERKWAQSNHAVQQQAAAAAAAAAAAVRRSSIDTGTGAVINIQHTTNHINVQHISVNKNGGGGSKSVVGNAKRGSPNHPPAPHPKSQPPALHAPSKNSANGKPPTHPTTSSPQPPAQKQPELAAQHKSNAPTTQPAASAKPKIDHLVVKAKPSASPPLKAQPHPSQNAGGAQSRIPASLLALPIPSVVDQHTIDTFVAMLKLPARDMTYKTLCAKLVGANLTLPVTVLKPYMKSALARYQQIIKNSATHPDVVNFQILSLLFQKLVHITVKDNEVALLFDWGAGKDTYDFVMPSVDQYIIDSHLAKDPYLVDERNRVRKIASESRTFVLKRVIRFKFDHEKILSVGSGDICVRAAWTSFSVSAWSEWRPRSTDPSFVQTDFKTGKAILRAGDDGKPILRNGTHYIPRRSDMWIIMSVMGFKAPLSVPDMPTSASSATAAS